MPSLERLTDTVRIAWWNARVFVQDHTRAAREAVFMYRYVLKCAAEARAEWEACQPKPSEVA